MKITGVCYFANRLCLLLFSEYKQINKEDYVFGSVGLSVCLLVDNITQKVMNRFG